MKRYIKRLFAVLAVAVFTAPIFAQTNIQDVDLTRNIETIASAVESGTDLQEPGTPLIKNGTVISRKAVSGEEDSFAGELILASGAWVDQDEIKVSECVVYLNGPEFAETIPRRRSREVNPKEIQLNTELLVYGFFAGVVDTVEGKLAAVEAAGIRPLK